MVTPAAAITMPSGPSEEVKAKCKKYAEGSAKWKKCIRKYSAELKDDDVYWAGAVLTVAEDYDGALEILALAHNQNDPRILTLTGYATRKLGRVEAGLAYYHKALALDPNLVETREYLGEGYLQLGKLAEARRELEEIAKRCGTGCEAYVALDKAIGDYPAD
jgi:tetratricopeptide (TPR) repeat protein